MKRISIFAVIVFFALFALTACNVLFHEIAAKDDMDKHVFVTRYFEVTFVAEGVPGYPQKVTVRMHDSVGELPFPDKQNNIFLTWMYGGKVFTGQEEITGDITVTAMWFPIDPNDPGGLPELEPIGGVKFWWVTFITNEGEPELPRRLVPDGYILARPGELTRPGYAFTDWYSDASYILKYDFSQPVHGNMVIFAGWTVAGAAPRNFTVNFYVNGGHPPPDTQTLQYNSLIDEPYTPFRDGYLFGGWYADTTSTYPWKFHLDKIIADMNLYARWRANTVPVEALLIEPKTMTLDLVDTPIGGVVARVLPITAPQTVTWWSVDENIATVSQTGVVTAKAYGETIVFAKTADGSFTAGCVIVVKRAITGLAVNPKTITMYRGPNGTNPQVSLNANIIPSDASHRNVIWTIENENCYYPGSEVISRPNSYGEYNRITAYRRGTVTIVATTEDGGFKDSCQVEVIQLPVAFIADLKFSAYSIRGQNFPLYIGGAGSGQSETVDYGIDPESTNNKNIIWSLENANPYTTGTTVATVNASTGRITAVRRGTVRLRATTEAGRLSGTVPGSPITTWLDFEVIQLVTHFNVDPIGTVTLRVGETERLIWATPMPSDANYNDMNLMNFGWQIEDDTIVKSSYYMINRPDPPASSPNSRVYMIDGLKAGTTTITYGAHSGYTGEGYFVSADIKATFLVQVIP